MSPGLVLNDLALYSLQIGLLVGLAAFVPGALRLRLPGVKLVYWQMLLVACLTLPLVRPWKEPVAIIAFPGASVAVQGTPVTAAAATPLFTQTEIAFAILALGIMVRLVWLGIGFLRLRGYRRRSVPLELEGGWSAPLTWGVEADLRVSDDIASPVTFGVFKPLVLLPANFHKLPASAQEAILAHECLHVRRKDWLFTLFEELIRALFWFHPAIWWLLGEIELAREQAVDRRAVEITHGREEYVDALLAIAGAPPALDLAPAPPFLRKRRLKHRVVAILKQAAMSKRHAASVLAVGLCLIAVASWVSAGAFPLVAAPKPILAGAPSVPVKPPAAVAAPTAVDVPPPPSRSAPAVRLRSYGNPALSPAPQPPVLQPSSAAPPEGVLGDILGREPDLPPPNPVARIKVGGNVQTANVMRRVLPAYPAIARAARIQDHVLMHVIIASDGTMKDITVVSGHPLLRQAAMDAVRQWQYKPTTLNGNPVEVETEVDVNFTLQQ